MALAKLHFVALLTAALFVANVLSDPLQAQTRTDEMFPSDVRWNADFLAQHHEPPLWTPTAIENYGLRLRLSADGINCMRAIIRLDETKRGLMRGVYILEHKCGRRKGDVERRLLRVSGGKISELLELARSEEMLRQPRQGWHLPEEESCLDGEEVLIELVDARGYRAAAANMSCTAPASFHRVAAKIVEIAGAAEARQIIRP